MKEYTQTELLFESVKGKKIVADFKGGSITSDAGLLLFRQLADDMSLFNKCSEAIRERRHVSYISHDINELLTQRVMQIAAGYFHAVDCNRLREDPTFKTICNIKPASDTTLGGQSTMTRLENSISRTDLYRLALAIGDQFMSSYSRPPKSIILDIDDTCDPTHGAQQLTLFNAYDDTYCYHPVHIYEGNSGKLVTAVLRPGKRPTCSEARSILKRVIASIRHKWPTVKILVRGDSHFCGEPVMELCESTNVEYILAVAKNQKLARLCEEGFALKRGYEPEADYRHYEAFDYAAGSWTKQRRVVARIEVKGACEDIRYIATNIIGGQAQDLYEQVYCQRGQAENWIKDHKNALRSDLTSCHRFAANQFRLHLHSMAYILLNEFRRKVLRKTKLARAQMDTIRLNIIKIGARIVEKSKVIRFHLSDALEQSSTFRMAYINLNGT